jgi:hypothetical protein
MSSDFITFWRLANLFAAMPAKHDHTSVVWGQKITTYFYKG